MNERARAMFDDKISGLRESLIQLIEEVLQAKDEVTQKYVELLIEKMQFLIEALEDELKSYSRKILHTVYTEIMNMSSEVRSKQDEGISIGFYKLVYNIALHAKWVYNASVYYNHFPRQ